MVSKQERKNNFAEKFEKYLNKYPRILIVGADNIGSHHMQCIRRDLRGSAVLLMGKNTMMRRVLRRLAQKNKALENLSWYVRGNIGFVFTTGDLADVRKRIIANKVGAPAKAGAIAPCDVIVPKGNTGMEPTQTAFLQALSIPSKIARGQIEIINDVHLISEGEKVTAGQATLLTKLNIRPFEYALKVLTVYDNGFVYAASVLDLTDDDIIEKFSAGVRNIACLSLETGFPTAAAVPHLLLNGYKKVLAVSLATDYTFPQSEKMKAFLENPDAFVVAPPVQKEAAPAEEEKEEEAEESDDDDMGFGLFD